MPQLRCDTVWFYSAGDESAFFEWAARIPGVSRIFGEGRSIVLVLRSARPSDTALRELLALFHRYKVPASQLAQFLTERNASWFDNPSAYWYKEVFARAV
jgi:hypothetical protein